MIAVLDTAYAIAEIKFPIRNEIEDFCYYLQKL